MDGRQTSPIQPGLTFPSSSAAAGGAAGAARSPDSREEDRQGNCADCCAQFSTFWAAPFTSHNRTSPETVPQKQEHQPRAHERQLFDHSNRETQQMQRHQQHQLAAVQCDQQRQYLRDIGQRDQLQQQQQQQQQQPQQTQAAARGPPASTSQPERPCPPESARRASSQTTKSQQQQAGLQMRSFPSHLMDPLVRLLRPMNKARLRLEKLVLKDPSLALPATLLANIPNESLELAGSGTFASVWHTSRPLGLRDSAAPSTSSLLPGQASTSSQATPRFPLYACKVLQLPIGVKGRRFYPSSFNAQAAGKGHGYNLHAREEWERQYDHIRYLTFFYKECEALVVCQGHPSIVTCPGFCIDDPHLLPTIVMGYAGISLWQVLFPDREKRQPQMELNWEQACAIIMQLLDAIDFMHWRLPASQGFCIHRDISPGNILISFPDGARAMPKAVLVDFGLAEHMTPKDLPLEEPYEWLQQGVAVGPEMRFIDPIMWSSRRYGRGTDIFGYGQTVLLLLFGDAALHPPVHSRVSKDEQFRSICRRRDILRNLLYQLPFGELLSEDASYPLHERWHKAPRELLRLLLRQASECCMTMRANALALRPPTTKLKSQLLACCEHSSPSLLRYL